MKIIETFEGDLYEGYINISLETETNVENISFGHGEPEDNCLARDLKGALYIADMLKVAYQAGQRGEELEWIIKRDKFVMNNLENDEN